MPCSRGVTPTLDSTYQYLDVTDAMRCSVYSKRKRAMQRRHFLRVCAALIAIGLPRPGRSAAGPATITLSPLGKSQVFDYAWLKGQARALANGVYQPPVSHIPDAVKALDYDQY